MKFDKLGWIVAAALAGGIAGAGFQGNTEKTGTVDLAKVFNDSEFAKKQTESLKVMGAARQGVIEFVRANPHMKTEDALKFKELTVKDSPTANDKADLERLKTIAQASESDYRTLTTKEKPQQAEIAQIEDFNKRKDSSQSLLEKWNADFSAELQTKQESLRTETLSRVKEAIQTVAKNQGFSIIFVQEVAPYSANDLTPDALKAMNAKK
jgi:Skp family chaperone for outer membrane proteins